MAEKLNTPNYTSNPSTAFDISSVIVPPDMPIMEAVKILNDTHQQIILVADANNKLLGVVSDSNVRRAILNHVDFDQSVSTIMVTNPITAYSSTSNAEIRALMERTQIHEIPIIDDEGHIVDLKRIGQMLQDQSEKGFTAVIMAGGLGERLRTHTADRPKPLIDVGGQPILFTILDQLIEEGFTTIFLALNYKGEMIREAVGNNPQYEAVVKYINEDKRLGTAGALKLLPEIPKDPFLVLNGDLLTTVAMAEMIRFHKFERNILTVALKKELFPIPYGCAEVEGTRITKMQEKPSHAALINTGVYVVDPIVLQNIPEDSFFDMTDIIDQLLNANLRVGSFLVHEYWLDIGQPAQLEQAQSDYPKYFPEINKISE
jgi:dTDP-glucose pyrophosphorylase